MERIKKVFIMTAIVFVNVITQIGTAGLLATGVYLLNSYFGWAADAPAWRYGLCGLLYLAFNAPFIWKQCKITYDAWTYLF